MLLSRSETLTNRSQRFFLLGVFLRELSLGTFDSNFQRRDGRFDLSVFTRDLSFECCAILFSLMTRLLELRFHFLLLIKKSLLHRRFGLCFRCDECIMVSMCGCRELLRDERRELKRRLVLQLRRV